MPRQKTRPVRLTLSAFETRLNPAYDMVIDGDPLAVTANVDINTEAADTVVYTATGIGATVNVADIGADLAAGKIVRLVTSDTVGGAAPGTITWTKDAPEDDLTLPQSTAGRLVFDTTDTAGAGVTLGGGLALGGGGTATLDFFTSGGTAELTDATVNGFLGLSASLGDGEFNFGSVSVAESATIDAGTMNAADGGTFTAGGNITVAAELTVGGAAQVRAGITGTLTLAGDNDPGAVNAVSGGGDLLVSAAAINVQKSIDLAGGTLTVEEGVFSFGTDSALTITADTLVVGDVNYDPDIPGFAAVLGAGAGQITADVDVEGNGIVAPGGFGAPGVLRVAGNIVFDGGRYDPDLGGFHDQLQVDGDVDLTAGATIGGQGTGLAVANSAVITFATPAGAVLGEFSNAPEDFVVAVGDDAVKLTYPAAAGQSVVINPAPGVVGKKIGGEDDDGTGFTAALTGPGELNAVYGDFGPIILVRGATAASNLTVTGKANGSNAIVGLERITIATNPLKGNAFGALSAGTSDVYDRVSVAGAARGVTLRDAYGPVTLGGTPAASTTLKARSLFAGVTSGAVLASVTAPGQVFGLVQAPKIGPVTVGTLAAATVTATAGPIGAVKVTGDTIGAEFNATAVKGGVGQLTFGRAFFGAFDVTVNAGANAVAGIKAVDLSAAVTARSVGAVNVTGSLDGQFDVAGKIASLTVGADSDVNVDANEVGAVKVSGLLTSALGEWAVAKGITSITAGGVGSFNFGGFDLTAGFLGSLTVIGSAKLDVDADVVNSTFTLTGNHLSGTANPNNPAGYGINMVTVAGNVLGSTFDLKHGSLTSFKAARFLDSKLFLDYDDAGPFDTAGAFETMTLFKLGSFTTTAKPLSSTSHPLYHSFANSQVAARVIGPVVLSTVVDTDTDDSPSGFKYQTLIGTPKAGGAALADASPMDDFFLIDLP